VILPDGRVAGTLCALGSSVRQLGSGILAELALFARLLAAPFGCEFAAETSSV
jgi:hypothetical protein